MYEPPSSDSLKRITVQGDRARRMCLAARRLPRFGTVAAAAACVASSMAAVLGGPRIIGLAVLAASAVLASLSLLAALRRRPIDDAVAAELDRAADLGGALRSAHWFVQAGGTQPDDSQWIDFHVDAAAKRAEGIDWPLVYRWPAAPRAALTTLALVLATLTLVVWPRPTRPSSSPRATDDRAPGREAATAQALPSALVPQLVEGMRAMESGKPPSREALSAIGKALDLAKSDRAAQKQIDGLLARVHEEGLDGAGQTGEDGGNGESTGDADRDPRDVYSTGLEWGYQEALAKASSEEPHPAAGKPLTPPPGDAVKGKDPDRESGATAADTLEGAPVKGDTKGQGAGFASLLFGKQQATDDDGKRASGKAAERTAMLAAALRNEVVHAREDVTGANVDATSPRRAAPPSVSAPATAAAPVHALYDRLPAIHVPGVPPARRQLVHDYFRRQPDVEPSPKRP